MGIVPREAILHPVVGHRGDHQQDVAHDAAEQTPSHEAVHLELRLSGLCRADGSQDATNMAKKQPAFFLFKETNSTKVESIFPSSPAARLVGIHQVFPDPGKVQKVDYKS